MSVTPCTDPVVLVDVDDLAEADLDADLADRLEADGRVFRRPGAAGAPADDVQRPGAGTGPWPGPAHAVSLARAIRRDGATAAAVHDLGPGAATLTD
jgi:hypothetical protein